MESLNPFEVLPEGELDFGSGFAEPTQSDKNARISAGVAVIASKNSITPDEAYNAYSGGSPSTIRDRINTLDAIETEKARNSFLQELAQTYKDSGKQLTKEDLDFVSTLSGKDLANPSLALERRFTREVMFNHVSLSDEDSHNLWGSEKEDHDAMDVYEKINTFNAYVGQKYREVDSEVSDQSWPGYLADRGKELLPVYTWYKTRNIVADTGGILAGENMAEQIAYLWGIEDIEARKQKFDAAVEYLKRDNPALARDFVNNVQEYSRDSQMLDSAFAVADTADVLDLGIAGAAIGLAKRASLRKSLAQSTAALNHQNPSIVQAVNATGNVSATASVAMPSIKSKARVSEVADMDELISVMKDVNPSYGNVDAVVDRPNARLSAGYLNDVATVLKTNESLVADILTIPNIERMGSGRAMNLAVKEVVDSFMSVHDIGASRGILDVKTTRASDKVFNNSSVEIRVGRQDNTLFDTDIEAKNAADAKGIIDYKLEETSGKWSIVVKRDLGEMKDDVIEALVIDNGRKPIDTIPSRILGAIRSADTNVSKANRADRLLIASGTGRMQKLVQDLLAPISSLSKKEGTRFKVMTNAARDRGRLTDDQGFARSVPQFEDEYYKIFNEYPSSKEISAYFTAKAAMDLDYMMRNMAAVVEKTRLGARSWIFPIKAPDGSMTHSPAFEGVKIDKLPDPTVDDNWRLFDPEQNKIIDSGALTPIEKKDLNTRVQAGNYHVIQIFDPNNRPLQDILPKATTFDPRNLEPVQFVITREARDMRINYKQLNYRDGVHVQYKNTGYLKQPSIIGKRYYGDRTVAVVDRKADGTALAERFNQAQAIYKDYTKAKNAVKAAQKRVDNIIAKGQNPRKSMVTLTNAISEKAKLINDLSNSLKGFMPPKEFIKLFKGDHPFDLSQPFTLLEDGKRFSDSPEFRNMGLKDMVNTSHNLSENLNRKFFQERGEGVYKYSLDKGTPNNMPSFTRSDPDLVDAATMIHKSLGEMVKSKFFDDYRRVSALEFIENFGDTLNVPQKDLRRNPIYHLYNPEWNTKADPKMLTLAQNMRDSVLQLLQPKSFGHEVHQKLKKNILDFLETREGPLADKIRRDCIDEDGIFKHRDPVRALRSYAFHTKMGMFNPATFFLNLQTLNHMFGVSPKAAIGAFKDMFFMAPLLLNDGEEMVKYLSKKSGNKFFGEMYQSMKEVGWNTVSGSASVIDDFGAFHSTRNALGKFMDLGAVFFRKSEEIIRTAAWSTAYREWRKANPSATIDHTAKMSILRRADTLSGNMTHSSQANIQQGLASVPTQFLSYQFRLAQQMLSGLIGNGELSRMEVARVLSWYSLMYGVPVAAGVPLAIAPLAEAWKSYALENDIDTDANLFMKVFTEGLSQSIFEVATGADMNVSQRWGPGASTFVADIISGDTTVLSLLAGPGGSALYDTMKAAKPGAFYLTRMFRDDPVDPEEPHLTLTAEDFNEVARNITSYNLAYKFNHAVNWGKYITKNNLVMADDVSPNEVWGLLMGLSPQRVVDTYLIRDILSNQKDAEREAEQQARKEMERSFLARDAGDSKNAEIYERRARVWLAASGIREDKKFSIMNGMYNNWETELERRARLLKENQLHRNIGGQN